MTVRIDGTNTVSNPAMTGSDADTGICFGDSVIEFSTSGTKRAAVMDSGNFVIEQGNLDLSDGNLVVASGHGIDFSDTANSSGTMGSELLDDYEEGTFTPTIAAGYNGVSFVTGYPYGHYTKIGNVVHVVINMYFSSTGHVTNARPKVGGLPFTSSNNPPSMNGTLNNGFTSIELSSHVSTSWYVGPNSTEATLYANNGANYNSYPNANATDDWLQISGTYQTAL